MSCNIQEFTDYPTEKLVGVGLACVVLWRIAVKRELDGVAEEYAQELRECTRLLRERVKKIGDEV